MPSINKPHKPKKKCLPKRDKNKDIAALYNSNKWVKLRNGYIMQHPLCEKCLEKGKITPAEEVHHIKPIGTGRDLIEMRQIAYNPDNLMSLCKSCHHEIHKQLRKEL